MPHAVPLFSPTHLGSGYNAAVDLIERNLVAGRGSKIAYRDSSGAYTYGEFAERVDRAANTLRGLGLEQEQRVMLCLLDGIDFPTMFLGAIKAGIVPIACNTSLTAAEYDFMLRDSGARALIVSDAVYGRFASVLANQPKLKWTIVSGDRKLADGLWLSELLAAAPPRAAAAATKADDVCFWLYSSGSTGTAKGVMHLHSHLTLTAELFAKPILGITENDTIFSASKLFFAYGLGNSLTFPLAVGATAVLMAEGAIPEAVFRVLQEHQPTIFCGAPTLYAGMLANPDLPKRGSLALRLCGSAAEPLPENIGKRWAEHFGVEILDGIGSTEMLHIYLSNRPGEVRYGTTGKPVPGYEIRLLDETGKPVAQGEIGELEVKGPTSAAGYWNLRETSRKTFVGEWTRSGDKYLEDDDGYFVYCGRADDMLKIGGIYVSPIEVEAALTSHAAVLEAAVVGQLDEQKLTKPKAYVVLKPDHNGTSKLARALQDYLRSRLARHKCPRWIEFTDELPKTATGKIQRFKLRTRDISKVSLHEIDLFQLTPLVGSEVPHSEARSNGTVAVAGGAWARELASMAKERRLDVVVEVVRAEVARVLSVDTGAVAADRPLRELGLDSMMVVELGNGLSRSVGSELPATLAFDYPTPVAIAAHLLDKVLLPSESAIALPSIVVTRPVEEPIAIVGMGCRYPGGVTDPESFWRLLANGVDAVTEVPAERWDIDLLYDPDPEASGKITTRFGGFIREVDRFDPEFFGIAPREALKLDPQQRLLLETSWEALERAGLRPETLMRSNTGVFVGMMSQDYGQLMVDRGGLEALDGYMTTGSAGSVASGRISYLLDLEGPSMTVDTACSSSLVTVHLACQALSQGECSLALAAGVTLMLTPTTFVEFSRLRGLSSDGRCKSFSAAADGAVWSEGCGMLVLERLSDARRNGHPVLALIRGTAVNQDGRSNGLTAPNGASQQSVIRQSLNRARVAPSQVDYVECHGTGTALGDPIEVQALGAALAKGRDAAHPVMIGSVKTNFGHTQAAAGVAGIIKVVLSLQEEWIPRSLHFASPSPHIAWSELPVKVAAEAMAWPRNNKPRRAGVSSFGISGTNAHVILEEAPVEDVAQNEASLPPPPTWPLILSAKSEGALRGQAERLGAHLREHPGLPLGDVAYSLAVTRSRFEQRAALVAKDKDELLAALDALAQGRPTPKAVLGRARSNGKVVFVFPGQGSQWEGMALGLLETSPVFKAQFEACERALAPHVNWSLTSVLRGEGDARLDRVDVVQPVLFAVMVSLAALWRSLGVEPAAVIGHSQGEIAAAFVAGILSLEDATKIVAVRSRVLRMLSGKGGMAAVELGVEPLEKHLARWGERLSIAAVNSPQSTLISGDPEAIDTLLDKLTKAQIFARKIQVDYASHCAAVEEVQEALLEQLGTITPQSGRVPFYSTVTGGRIESEELDAGYWYQNLRQTVRFADAVDQLGDDYGFFVEISPHPVLTLALQEALEHAGRDAAVVGTLRREEGDYTRFLLSLGELHAHGLELDWHTFFSPYGLRRVTLPTYAFQRERFWLDAPKRKQTDVVSAGLASAEHPLLAAAVPLADGEGYLFTGRLSLSDHPWLADHAVFGTPILPGTAFLELAFLAGQHTDLDFVEDLTLEAPLALPAEGAVLLQMSVGAADTFGRRPLSIYGKAADAPADAAWTRHASGMLAPTETQPAFDLRAWPPVGAEPVPMEGVYETLAEAGLGYGPSFRGLRAVWRQGEELFAEAHLAEELDEAGFGLHPALLDAALHGLVLDIGAGAVALPFSWAGVSLHSIGARSLRVRFTRDKEDGAVAVFVADAAGEPVASVQALALRPVSSEQFLSAVTGHQDALFHLRWMELPDAQPAYQPIRWAILGSGAFTPADDRYLDFAALQAALDEGVALPEAVIVPLSASATHAPSAAHQATAACLTLLQGWIGDARLAEVPLVLLTERAIATGAGEDVLDLTHAAVWGLVRTAQNENPGLPLFLADTDGKEASQQALVAALAPEERQFALRDGKRFVARLERGRSKDTLSVPDTPAWRLDIPAKGSFDDLTFTSHPDGLAPLAGGQVRIAVRAAGVNFRDVVIALGMISDNVPLGSEGAGIVLETGPDVDGFAAGDRVMGMFQAAFGPVAIADVRTLAPLPADWSFAQGASVPIVFLTAYYGLVELGKLKAGQRVLIHAAAGGVGGAAVQIARHLGAEVFATASPGKWPALKAQGFDAAHLASSRDLGFEAHFLRSTVGHGMDVVLDCLAQEFVDASLRLLPQGGHFLEMGKTDIREAAAVAAAHPGVIYQAFDLREAGPERIQEMLAELLKLFKRGALRLPPITSWDIRRAPHALRTLAQGRHIGKFVLSLPRPLDPSGTVLITGGTGTLGGLVARHLVKKHGVKHLLLTSRQGASAAGAAALRSALEADGAEVRIAACDAADRHALEALLDGIAVAHPLTAVMHTAGVLDDGVLGALTPERLERVLSPKLDAAWHLHELTGKHDLAAFILFSSVAGVLGAPGQANYAAANTFLDALAQHRRALGLPATSLAWGYWAEASGMTAQLNAADLTRMRRQGMLPLSSDQGLALLDAVLQRPEAMLIPCRFDLASHADTPPALLRGLIRTRRIASNTVQDRSFAQKLLLLSEVEREQALLDLVRTEAAAVLGLAGHNALEHKRPLKEFGLDSLMAVEIRNKLSAAMGLKLPATLLFDYPTPAALADFLALKISGSPSPSRPALQEERQIRVALASVSIQRLRQEGLLERLLSLADPNVGHLSPLERAETSIKTMGVDELIKLAMGGANDSRAGVQR